jgi:hypothetical protein
MVRFCAFGTVLVFAILAMAQTASGQPPRSASLLTLQRASAHADVRLRRKPTLFVLTPNGLLNEYDLKGKQVGQLQLSGPGGESLCSDGEQFLYVVTYSSGSFNPIAERFPIGSTLPDLLMNESPGQAYMCAVSRMTGDIALTIEFSGLAGGGFVMFHSGQTTPYTYAPFQRDALTSAPTFGRFGNLFIVGSYGFVPSWWSSQTHSYGMQYLPLPRVQGGGPGVGAQIDRRGNFVVELKKHKGLFVYPPGALMPGSKIKRRFVRMDGVQSPYAFEFTAEGDEFFTIDNGHVYGFLYPQGGYPVVTINVNAVGIAIVPGPHPG